MRAHMTDDLSGVREVILSYSSDTSWANLTMMWIEGDTYAGNITAMPDQTNIRYSIIAYDNANNLAVNDNLGFFYSYTVIPEFFPSIVVPLFAIITLVAVIFAMKARKLAYSSQNK